MLELHVDYIHTTIKMIQELSNQSRGMKIREDNVLSMFSASLKDLANELEVFILTASQVNGQWENKEVANANLIRGSQRALTYLILLISKGHLLNYSG